MSSWQQENRSLEQTQQQQQWQVLRIIVCIIYQMYIVSLSSIIKLIDNQQRLTDHETFIHTKQPWFQLHHCL